MFKKYTIKGVFIFLQNYDKMCIKKRKESVVYKHYAVKIWKI